MVDNFDDPIPSTQLSCEHTNKTYSERDSKGCPDLILEVAKPVDQPFGLLTLIFNFHN